MQIDLNELMAFMRAERTLSSETTNGETLGRHIVIADRGHVWVGNVTTTPEHVIVRDGAAVRRWGTTRGLGELADNGPLPNTVLDPVSRVLIYRHAVIALVACKESAWKR